jgi:protein gp37
MSANSKIEWTDHTFNPWIGCTKVSPGCAHCYAETEDKRRGWTPDGWGKGKPRKRTTEAYWRQPRKWDSNCRAGAPPAARPRVFPSLCDWLDDEVRIEWLVDFLDLIRLTPNLDWLLLTKRPELWMKRLVKVMKHNEDSGGGRKFHQWILDWVAPIGFSRAPANVWLGVSVEDQPRAEERVMTLLKTPAAVRFLSCEPLLGPINLRKISATPFITISALEKTTFAHQTVDWVIVGGESGPHARPCAIEWVRDLVLQCQTATIPVFVKQLGAVPTRDGLYFPPNMIRDRKGGNPAEWPEDIRVREMSHSLI